MIERPAATQYPVLEVIRRRWSPYLFADGPVEAEKLRALFEAARWSASSFNEQPWRFLVATRDDAPAFERALGCLVEANQAWAKHAPVLLLALSRDAFTKNGKPNRVSQHDLGLAMAQLTLQATALDLHVHQMAGIDPERVCRAYDVPEGFTPLTAAAIGYAGENPDVAEAIRARDQGPRHRMPFDQFVFGGSFGEPSGLFD